MRVRAFFAMLVLWGTAAAASAANVTRIDVYPPDINLNTKLDFQRFIVVATRDDGVTLDVTNAAAVRLADAAPARLDGRTLYPAADGNTTLEVEYQGFKASATVAVKDAAADRPISFQLDVMPVFMRSGCNTGSCHGAARGKDGFRLSLFGFDPNGDYYRITREETRPPHQPGRARSQSADRESRSARCPTRAASGSRPTANTTRRCCAGWKPARRWTRASRRWSRSWISIPPKAVLEGAGTTQQFLARARYTDGTDRDVTDLARVPDQQRQFGADHSGRPGDGRRARRSLRDGPLRDAKRSAARCSSCPRTCSTRRRPSPATTSTSWSAPSCRSFASCPATCAPTRSSSAA